MSDSDRAASPGPRPGAAGTVARPPGAGLSHRRAQPAAKPNSSRSAGHGGSSNTMLKLYTDDSPGLRVDPFVVIIISLSFIGSIFFLHIAAKVVKSFTK
ncbi:hypothetical protein BOTBODRAFT_39879 [Botryobasidium botryosum FD-172 SS1]|uniref:Protein transport protein Sec61 subunit beta n=1 Tax=Botryobasidium botryosum (strain FD-172 SS1) TaxID=930990 RepID=A0A067M2Y3_BOTB1|nr:hypothetical protein BOTBODRAFT_39879 [Botryobasidium botryosum FD-172 SS1]